MNVFIPSGDTNGSLESSTDSSEDRGGEFGAPVDVHDALTRISERLDAGREAEASSILKKLTDHYITATTSDIDSLFQEETLVQIFTIVEKALNETTLHMLTFLSVFYNNYEMIRRFVTSGPENLAVFLGPLKYLENNEVCSSYCDFLKDTIYTDEAFGATIIGALFAELESEASRHKAQNVGHVLSVLVIGQNEGMCYNMFAVTEKYIESTFKPLMRSVASPVPSTSADDANGAGGEGGKRGDDREGVDRDATGGSKHVEPAEASAGGSIDDLHSLEETNLSNAGLDAPSVPNTEKLLSAIQVLIEAIPLCVRAYDALQARMRASSVQGKPQRESDRDNSLSVPLGCSVGGEPDSLVPEPAPFDTEGEADHDGTTQPHVPEAARDPEALEATPAAGNASAQSPVTLRSPRKLSINLDLIPGSSRPVGAAPPLQGSTVEVPAGDLPGKQERKFYPLFSLGAGQRPQWALTPEADASCEHVLNCTRDFLVFLESELLPSPRLGWLVKTKLLELILALAMPAAESRSPAMFDVFMRSKVLESVLSLCEGNPTKSVAISYCSQILDACTARAKEFLIPAAYWQRAFARLSIHERELIDYALFKAASIETLSDFCEYAEYNGLVPQLFRDDFLTLLVQYFQSYVIDNGFTMDYKSLFRPPGAEPTGYDDKTAGDGSGHRQHPSLERKPTEFFQGESGAMVPDVMGEMDIHGPEVYPRTVPAPDRPPETEKEIPPSASSGSQVEGSINRNLGGRVEHISALVVDSPRLDVGPRFPGHEGDKEEAEAPALCPKPVSTVDTCSGQEGHEELTPRSGLGLDSDHGSDFDVVEGAMIHFADSPSALPSGAGPGARPSHYVSDLTASTGSCDFLCLPPSGLRAFSGGDDVASRLVIHNGHEARSIPSFPSSSLAHSSSHSPRTSLSPSPTAEQWASDSPLASYFSWPLRPIPGLGGATAHAVWQFASYFVLSRQLCQALFAQKPNSSVQDLGPSFVSSLTCSAGSVLLGSMASSDPGMVISPAVLPNLRALVPGAAPLASPAVPPSQDSAGPMHCPMPKGPAATRGLGLIEAPQTSSPGRPRSPSNPAALACAGTTVFEGFGQLDMFNATSRRGRDPLESWPAPAQASGEAVALQASSSQVLTASVLTEGDLDGVRRGVVQGGATGTIAAQAEGSIPDVLPLPVTVTVSAAPLDSCVPAGQARPDFVPQNVP